MKKNETRTLAIKRKNKSPFFSLFGKEDSIKRDRSSWMRRKENGKYEVDSQNPDNGVVPC